MGLDLGPNCLQSLSADNKICDFLKKIFQEHYQSVSLDPDQAQHIVGPDHGPNGLAKVSSRQRNLALAGKK